MNLLSAQINYTSLLIVIAIIAVLATVFSTLIVIISKACKVEEDERIVKITENLAGANCGGCGYNGCSDFAKALLEGKAQLSNCGATSEEGKQEICKVLGVEFSATEKTVAVVKCSGGNNVKKTFNYVGNFDCSFIKNSFGGNKACSFACLGAGNCQAKCTNGAIKMVDGVAKVDKAECGSCGACVIACPKNLIELIPATAKVYVACSSKCKGKAVMEACESGCIGCGLCAKNCPQGAITMQDNLPIIDYAKCTGCKICVSKCPRKTIKEM